MENASKALIMAGGVLISLMIIGALMLMFNSLSSYQNSENQNAKEAEIISFNNQYTSFARDNVRGSDIYSLLNKVVDYNKRKSNVEGATEEGQAIAYKPLKVTVIIKKETLQKIWYTTDRGATHLIGTSLSDVDIVVSGVTNDFDDQFGDHIKSLETGLGGEGVARKLVTAMTSIFIEDTSDENAKNEAIRIYNSISTNKISSYDKIKESSDIRKNVYLYSEYIQFKRAKFNCIDTKYDNGTGRIIEMKFESNGKFE